MLRKFALNDIKKSKFITVLLVLFIMTASTLFTSAIGLVTRLSSSVSTLMEDAKTADFMQMHSGDLDEDQIKKFAEENENIEAYQILSFLNIDGSNISYKGNSLNGTMIDNGFCIQSPNFDYLIDLKGDVINVEKGQVYIPMAYMKDWNVDVGDELLVCGSSFEIAGSLQDSEMNSNLASSKRFLINYEDYEALKEYGNEEYLIEFKGINRDVADFIQHDYEQSALYANGPAITYKLFYMLNTLTDGIMIGIIILVSIVIVLIAFLCIRFNLLTKLSDDYSEIGVMRAIGVYNKEIRKIYLKKYIYIAAIGCVLGYILSFVVKGLIVDNMSIYMGKDKSIVLTIVAGIVAASVLFLFVIAYVNGLLRRINKVSATQALREGAPSETFNTSHFTLTSNSFLSPNLYMSIKDILSRKKLYITFISVLVLSVFIVIVPQNLYQTIASDDFVSFMGVGQCNVRIDLQQLTNIDDKAEKVSSWLKSNNDVVDYSVYCTKSYCVSDDSGAIYNMKIESGDYEKFQIDYIEGRKPIKEDEIALSYLNSQDIGKKIGDTLEVCVDDKWQTLTVTGIYSDITNGGKTAKAKLMSNSEPVMFYVICVNLQGEANQSDFIDNYKNELNYGKIASVNDYISETLGGTIKSIKMAGIVAIIMVLAIVILITALFMKMIIAKDRSSIAIMKALGVSNSDIYVQYIARAAIVIVLSLLAGIIISNTLGGLVAGMIIKNVGIGQFKFIINPLIVYVLCPLGLLIVSIVTTCICTTSTGKIEIMENIKE